MTPTGGALPWPQMLDRFFVRFVVRYGYLAMLIVIVVEFYRHEVKSVSDMHRAEVDRLALDREMAEARLQVLQAQIEPHFLFNTLANVRRLYQTDPAAGRDDARQPDALPRGRACRACATTARPLGREADADRGLPERAGDPHGPAAGASRSTSRRRCTRSTCRR